MSTGASRRTPASNRTCKAVDPGRQKGTSIFSRSCIGSIMLFNVWVLIWPNQPKILELVPASDEQKAKARKVALLASRTNFALSIPLVLCMGSATHGLPF